MKTLENYQPCNSESSDYSPAFTEGLKNLFITPLEKLGLEFEGTSTFSVEGNNK